ncbi:pyridoxal phosphate-dependent transferase [Chytriomyces sp. MP71]|nr:pyridoxal phosphate-dependent transferase [Chytriomyces sp. MP71]
MPHLASLVRAVRLSCTAPIHRTLAFTASARSGSHLLGLYPQPNITFTHGFQSTLFDANGNSYLDFNSGIAVNALGHGDPDVVAAVTDQAPKLIHLSNLYANEHGAKAAELLVDSVIGKDASRQTWWGSSAKVFFCNSGTEANEASIKFARKYARENNRTATGILSFTHAFHGRSMGALSATPNLKYQAPFAPLVPGFVTSEYNNAQALDAVDWSQICGVIVEPMQGEGGVFPAKKEFLAKLRAKCDEVRALLIFDEIQCGIGRSGRMYMHHCLEESNTCQNCEFTSTGACTGMGVNPDLLSLAKPLANGIPMGAVVLTQRVAAHIKPGDHGTTFGGGPLATRVAGVVLAKVARPTFLAHVRGVSNMLFERLRAFLAKFPGVVKEVRGRGLLVGMELHAGVNVSEFVELALKKGNVLAISAGQNTVRLAPPLVITHAEVERACNVFEEVLVELAAKEKK